MLKRLAIRKRNIERQLDSERSEPEDAANHSKRTKIMSASQLNDLRSYSRHWLGEFIDMYQTEQCLWQPKHPDYSNHSARNKAYDKLVDKLKEVEPNPDRPMVVRKINSLRSAFRREYRKTSSKNNYETRLWYYEKLLFIADQSTKRLSNSSGGCDIKPKRSLTMNFDDEDGSIEFEEEHLDNTQANAVEPNGAQNEQDALGTVTVSTGGNCVTLVKNEEQQQHQQQAHAQQTQPQHTTAVKVLEITSLDSDSQREIQQAVNSLEQQHHMQQQQQQQANTQLAQLHHHTQVPTIQISREHLTPLFGNPTSFTTTTGPTTTHRQEDEYDAVGINVGSKLRSMNPTQRIIAEKLISDVLFNGQLDNLNVSSSLSQ